jgi:hypothetical protein
VKNLNVMKNILFIVCLAFIASLNAQNFDGKGDQKLQIGSNFQDNSTGIVLTYDYGLGENISLGFVGAYALGINDIDADFSDRLDIRARFNANIGNVINIDDNFDIYPGISLGLKNFGGHLGMRYFFTDGFGIFTEFGTPFAKYKTGELTPAEEIHNQFTLNIGAVFNL